VKKVLVVDDEPLLRDLLAAFLSSEGYEVAVAANGRAMLEVVARERPDLVLMDVMMPGLDGREAFRLMQAQSDLQRIPVVMTSAAVGEDRLDPGIAAFLPKPFDLDQLLETVARLVGPAAGSNHR
jgi:CheY-like chemotaxis protein